MILTKKRLREIIKKLKGDERPGYYATAAYIDILADHIKSVERNSANLARRLETSRQTVREKKVELKASLKENKRLQAEVERRESIVLHQEAVLDENVRLREGIKQRDEFFSVFKKTWDNDLDAEYDKVTAPR